MQTKLAQYDAASNDSAIVSVRCECAQLLHLAEELTNLVQARGVAGGSG